MEKKSFLVLFISLAVLIGLVHSLAQYFSLYWQIPFLDSVVHFLSGFLFGLFFVVVKGFLYKRQSTGFLLLPTILLILMAGLFWEWSEVVLGINNVHETGYLADTLLDLVCNVLGALAAIYFVKKAFKAIL